jgi:hypothetical protein
VLTALVKRVVEGGRGVSIEDPDGLERVLAQGAA